MAIARLGAYLLGAAFPGLPGQAAGVRYFFFVGGYYEFEGGVIFFFASLSFDLFFPLHSDSLISKMADVDVDAFSVT